MKKIVLTAVTGIVVMAIAGVLVFRATAAKEEARAMTEVSPRAAKVLQAKIDAMKDVEDDAKHTRGSTRIEVSETELESYLLYSLKEEIPAQVDSADVQLSQDIVSLDTQITFASNATGNPVFDAVVGGTHNLFVKGKLVAQQGEGKFELQEVRVDSIPVPNVLIQALIKKYVKPKYPEVDINEPFVMPYGIEDLKVEQGKATIVY